MCSHICFENPYAKLYKILCDLCVPSASLRFNSVFRYDAIHKHAGLNRTNSSGGIS